MGRGAWEGGGRRSGEEGLFLKDLLQLVFVCMYARGCVCVSAHLLVQMLMTTLPIILFHHPLNLHYLSYFVSFRIVFPHRQL